MHASVGTLWWASAVVLRRMPRGSAQIGMRLRDKCPAPARVDEGVAEWESAPIPLAVSGGAVGLTAPRYSAGATAVDRRPALSNAWRTNPEAFASSRKART